jgi:regulator of protease activity HflC (stomatin/prohibitin superfamily)
LHLKIPFWQKAKLFNIQTLEYSISKDFDVNDFRALGDEPVSAITADGKKVSIEGTILLRLDIEHIPAIWQWVGEDFVAKIVRPTVRSRLRMIAAKYEHQHIVTHSRAIVEGDAKTELEGIFHPRGIRVENVLLSDISQQK